MGIIGSKAIESQAAAPSRLHFTTLDGLRGLAALWVVLGHAVGLSGESGGAFVLLGANSLAVDLFMMLSGFLMVTQHGAASARSEGAASWVRFWTRRFFRLAPLYYAALVAVFVLAGVFVAERAIVWSTVASGGRPQWVIDASPASFAAHLGFLFGLSPRLYWSTALPDWSLSLEAQFYLVFPFLMIAARRLGMAAVALGLTAVSLIAMRLAPGYFLSFHLPSALPMKLSVFLGGMSIAAALRLAGWRRLALAGLGVVVAACPVVPADNHFIVAVRTGLAAGLAGLVLNEADALPPLLARVVAAPAAMLSTPPLRRLGDWSYAAYLLHLPIMVIGMGLAESSGLSRASRPELFGAALAITLPPTYALAWAAHRWIETPGIALGRSVTGRRSAAGPVAELP